jgi:hypothetical protein
MQIHSVGIDLGKTTFHLALGAVGMKPSAVRAFVRNDQLPGTRSSFAGLHLATFMLGYPFRSPAPD